MTGRTLCGIRPSKGGTITAPAVLTAILAALFMVLGTAHDAAHGDEPHTDCIAGHVSFAAGVKLAPCGNPDLPAPKFLSYRLAAPQPVAALKETRLPTARSRSPPLQSSRSV